MAAREPAVEFSNFTGLSYVVIPARACGRTDVCMNSVSHSSESLARKIRAACPGVQVI